MAEPVKGGECVKVVIRCRPMSRTEINDGREDICEIDVKNGTTRITRPGTQETKDFTYDAVYDAHTIQGNFYKETGYGIVESVIDGYNGTIFAYGQTGTGKTHTMVGPPGDPEMYGVIPRTFSHIFTNINACSSKKFLVRASFLEIYNEEIRDLLSKDPKAKLDLKDHPDGGVFVKDLSNLIVKNEGDLQKVMDVGQSNRSVASTMMNNESSRSHSIFTITIETAENGPDGKEHIRVGKMNMVDLAGSERQSKTGATGATLKEATKINMSLSALGNVISALVDAKTTFIPYRDSKLTRLLQDSLGGNTKTVMCACIGPVDYNYDETLSTLRYAYRAKSIKNKPKINEDPKDAMIREFQDEIGRLKRQLQERAGGGGGGGVGGVRKPRVKAPTAEAAAAAQQEQEVIIEKEIVEVEKEVIKEVIVERVVDVGITDEQLASIQASLDEEKRIIEEETNTERTRIEAEKNMAEEEKQRLLQELQERKQKAADEANEQMKLMENLRAMEEKMLVGTQVMEKAMQQELELKKAEADMEERRRLEQRMKEELEDQEAEKLNLEEKYSSAEDQVQKMTAKLEKLWHRHKNTQAEIQDLQREFQLERDDMLETVRDLRKEVKLVCLTIDSFMPAAWYQQIVDRAHYDETIDDWVLEKIDLAGNRVGRSKQRGPNDPQTMLRGHAEEGKRAEAMQQERQNVYFCYTEDGGAARAQSVASPARQRAARSQRAKSAGRPGTANRRGRAGAAASVPNFLHSQPEPEEAAGGPRHPKARGLVQ